MNKEKLEGILKAVVVVDGGVVEKDTLTLREAVRSGDSSALVAGELEMLKQRVEDALVLRIHYTKKTLRLLE